MENDARELNRIIRTAVDGNTLKRIVVSRPVARSDESTRRMDVRPILLRGQRMFQWTSRVGQQEIHDNRDGNATLKLLSQVIGHTFRQVHVVTGSGSWSARFSRRGKCHLWVDDADWKTGTPANDEGAEEHNRQRRYLIQDGRPVPFLVATGIMTKRGRVRAKYSRKFGQINRFVEFIADVKDRLPERGTISIVDFGCGKSYLTFATHYYLTEVAQRSVQIVGLDRHADIVRRCREITGRLGLHDIRFEEGDISVFEPSEQVNLAIALHACDTATDDALLQAVRWSTDVILAVPCCQHELAALLPDESKSTLTRHGILRERFCSVATDAIRAALLEQAGYQTQVIEFIDMEHTAKNVLIRAVRRPEQISAEHIALTASRLRQFSSAFGIPSLRLEREMLQHGLLTGQATTSDNSDPEIH